MTEGEQVTLMERLQIDTPVYDIVSFVHGHKIWVKQSEELGLYKPDAVRVTESTTTTYQLYLEYAIRVMNEAYRSQPSYEGIEHKGAMNVQQYRQWRKSWSAWIRDQTKILVLFLSTLQEYVNYGYRQWNHNCRERGTIIPEVKKLQLASSLVPSLPTPVQVNRFLHIREELPIGKIITEESLMSTCLIDRLDVLADERDKDTYYLVLDVPAGTPVICLLNINEKEWEFLFPAGVQYILDRKEGNRNLTTS